VQGDGDGRLCIGTEADRPRTGARSSRIRAGRRRARMRRRAVRGYTEHTHDTPLAMSFQAYLDDIRTKTGMGPDDFRRLAADKGCATRAGLRPGVKAAEIVEWLKADVGPGHGHAMAIVALPNGSKREGEA
jgi:hypothetical protein